MKVSYKKIFILQNFNESLGKLNLETSDYAVLEKLSKVVKKLAGEVENFNESIEDLRLDHCMKDGHKIVRENNQLQWTAEGEKAFRKAYKELLNQEVEIDESIKPLSYNEILSLLPNTTSMSWEDVKENLEPFFEYNL
jgi:hypothetical protein